MLLSMYPTVCVVLVMHACVLLIYSLHPSYIVNDLNIRVNVFLIGDKSKNAVRTEILYI